MTYTEQRLLDLLKQRSFRRTKTLPIAAVGGMESGAIPIVTSAVIAYEKYGRENRPLEGFWLRREVKQHGTRQTIEGTLPARSRVLIVFGILRFESSGSCKGRWV